MGMEKIPGYEFKPCMDAQHNPPTHICIPEGYQYRHKCPSCGKEVVLRPPSVICENFVYNGPVPPVFLADRELMKFDGE